jgi:hypothetical protein
MSCHEKRRLLMVYAVAIERHAQASADWINCVGCVSRDDYRHLKNSADRAKRAVEEARLRYLEHSDQHRC